MLVALTNTFYPLGTTLIRKYKAAIRDRNLQVESHRGFTSTIAEDVVIKWEDICTAWEADQYNKSAKSPYYAEENCKL